jgi:alpha-beta hydrolase superfamily lysophospholipase
MQETTASLTTTDGIQLHTIQWLPDIPAKAVVLLAHGLGEHSGRYRHVAQALTNAGYAVYALDHRGHGRSGGVNGYFGTIERPVDDLESYFKQIQAGHPDTKIFVYGHSMGALISLLFVQRHQDALAGWISQGTPLNVDSLQPAPLIAVGKFLSRVWPMLRFAPLDINGISRDPNVIEAYKTDPYNAVKRHRVSLLMNILGGGQEARKDVSNIRLPLLVLHGGADPVCPPSGSQLLYNNTQSTDKTLKLYDGLYHEIHNEPEQAQVFDDVIAWLNAH